MSSNVHVSFDEALRLARQHRANGNLIAADRAYRDMLDSVGEDADVLHEHGLVCFFRGNVREAHAQTRRAVELAPETPLYRSNFAIMANAAGHREEAVAAWRRTLEIDPTFIDAYTNLAKVLIEAGETAEAARLCREALSRMPANANAAVNLGLALQADGDLNSAVEAWERAVSHAPDHPDALSNLTTAYRELGRAEDAEEMGRRAVEAAPNSAVAHNNYGNCLIDRGDVDTALHHFQKAADLDPKYVQAYDNVGVALQAQDRPEEAARWHRFAIAIDDAFATAHYHLSVALRESGDIAAAESAAHQAILLAPEELSYQASLAQMLLSADRADEAEALLNRVLEQHPESAETHIKLARALEHLNRFEEAKAAARTAIEMQPDQPWPYHALSSVQFMAGELDAAVESGERAVSVAPNFAHGYAWLANIHQVLGDQDAAERQARTALESNPNAVGAYMTLANAKTFHEGDPDLAAMERVRGETRGAGQRMILSFALGKAYEDLKRRDEAFEAYKTANDIRRGRLVFDPANHAQQFAAIKRIYSRERLDELAGAGDPSPVPVFVLGMPRSGTTLVEQILASHPQVYGAGERPTMGQLAQRAAANPTREVCAEIGREYVETLRAFAPDADRITDKMPGNFSNIGLIASALPNAAIVHCRRDPVDTCWSCFKQNFARGQHWSYDLSELGQQYRHYADLMAYWREVLPGRFLEVDYEAVVQDTEAVARQLVAHIGLDWDDRCLAFHETDRPVMTASKAQVRQPIYSSSMQKWRRYEHHLQPLLAELGELVPERPAEASG